MVLDACGWGQIKGGGEGGYCTRGEGEGSSYRQSSFQSKLAAEYGVSWFHYFCQLSRLVENNTCRAKYQVLAE